MKKLCMKRSNLTVLITDLDVVINHTKPLDEYDRIFDDLEDYREYLCYRISLTDEELSRRNLTYDSIYPTVVKTRPPRIVTSTPGPHYSEPYEFEVEPNTAMLSRPRNPVC